MTLELNTRYLKLTGRGEIELDKPVELGTDLEVIVTVERVERKDNQDGTFDEIYKASLFAVEGESDG